ncbi:MAG: hypothetical protein ACPGWR_26360, partial [Ardenticatenaceae bacterium]
VSEISKGFEKANLIFVHLSWRLGGISRPQARFLLVSMTSASNKPDSGVLSLLWKSLGLAFFAVTSIAHATNSAKSLKKTGRTKVELAPRL